MNLIHEKIIRLLLDNSGPVTSKHLSQMLGISVRSVKTYISQINDEAQTGVIVSSAQGYTINRNINISQLIRKDKDIPQNFEERRNYIIREFLLKHSSSLQIDELCDELCVSEPTLRADVTRINRLNENYKIILKFKKDTLEIEGPERALRKLYSLTLMDNIESSYFDYNLLQKEFEDFNIGFIVTLIRKVFGRHNYFINEFALFNMTLHVAVIIDRLKKDNYVQQFENLQMNAEEEEIVSEICEGLEDYYDVKFTQGEKGEIYVLFRSNANLPTTDEYEKLKELVGNEISDETLELIEEIRERYYVDLSNQTFMMPFALHLKNMIYRAENGKSIFNPLSETIIHSQPIVFDIALFVAMKIMDSYDIAIDKGEVCFLALHIGGEIERQRQISKRIRTVLLCPSYMDISSQLYNKLLLAYSNEIEIVSVIQQPSEIGRLQYDLLISTIRTESARSTEILISPFLSQKDKIIIQDGIESARNRITGRVLKKHFDDYFEESLFFYKPKGVSEKGEVISLLADNLIDVDYVSEDFKESVMRRENAATTAFGMFAVPHSMEMDALKTSVSVLIDPTGIVWGQQRVFVVLMMSIRAQNHEEFTQLYEALIAVFSEENNIRMICGCRTFKEYKETLLSLID
ncbi:MAG: PRD domain-containing protein [Erysipelotrichaceae bacterium]|nr:PRD domain-containing protein [Erysipelotrichaceae bacterium]